MSTSLLYREFQRPTAVELSVWCRFTGADKINLCVAKGDLLEVYAVHKTRNEEDEDEDEDSEEEEGSFADKTVASSSINTTFRLRARYTLHGRVETLNRVSFPAAVAKSCGESGALDALLLTFAHEQKCCVVAFDRVRQGNLRTLAMFNFSAVDLDDSKPSGKHSGGKLHGGKHGGKHHGGKHHTASVTTGRVGEAVVHQSTEFDNRVERSGTSLAIVDHSSRCAVLMFHDEQLVVIPFKTGAVGTSTTSSSGDPGDAADDDDAESEKGMSSLARLRMLQRRNAKKSTLARGIFTPLVLDPYVIPLGDIGPKDRAEQGRQTAVVDLALLEGFHEPVLAVLQEAPMRTWTGSLSTLQNTSRITAVSLNVVQRRHPCIWSFEGLPHDALRLHPVPSPCGGCLVRSTNALLYFSQNRRCGVAVNGFAAGTVDRKVCPVTAPRLQCRLELDGARSCFLSPTRMLFAGRSGEFFLVDFVVVTGVVHGLSVSRPGFVGSVPSCVVASWERDRLMDGNNVTGKSAKKKKDALTAARNNSFVFVGSTLGDSLLLGVRMEESKEDGSGGESLGGGDKRKRDESVSTEGDNKRRNIDPEDDDEEDDEDMDDEDEDLYGGSSSTSGSSSSSSSSLSSGAASRVKSGVGTAGGAVMRFDLLDSLSNIGPISATLPLQLGASANSTFIDNSGGARGSDASSRGLLLASGVGARDGGLTVIRPPMRPDVVISMNIKGGCHGVWSMVCDGSDDEEDEDDSEEDEDEDEDEAGTRNDRFLMLSTEKKTKVIHFASKSKGAPVMPVPLKNSTQGNHFLLSQPTIFSGNLLNGKVLIQICQDRMRVLKAVSNPTLPVPLCSDGVFSDPKSMGIAETGAKGPLKSDPNARVVAASMSDPYVLLQFSDGSFLLTGVNPRNESISSKRMDISGAIRSKSEGTANQGNAEVSAFTLFRDEDFQGKRNYIRRATRERSNFGEKAAAAVTAAVEAATAQASSSSPSPSRRKKVSQAKRSGRKSSSKKKKSDDADDDDDDDEDDMFLYGDGDEGDSDGDDDSVMAVGGDDTAGAAESAAAALEEELALEGQEGLGDDGRVRFYVALCPANGSSLHILAIPSLEPVFQYNFDSHPVTQVGMGSGSTGLLSVSLGPQLLVSCLPQLDQEAPGAQNNSSVNSPAASGSAEEHSSASPSRTIGMGSRKVTIVDIALHFVGPLGGSSPTLVMALATSSGDVYVYHLHRSPEELEHAWIRNLVQKQGPLKARASADVSSVPLADLDLSGDGMRGFAATGSALKLSAADRRTMFDHGGSVHMMAFVRVPQSCVTRAPRNARSINTQTHANLIKKQRLYRMPNVGGQSCIFYRGFNSLWISSERGFPIVRQVTPTDVMSDISSEINASAAAEAAAMNNPSSPRTPALPTTDTLATVCAFHHKSVCVRGAVLVTPDGTTTICGIGKDDTGNNAEQEDEFVKEGLSVDRLRLGCTVHAVQEVPPPLRVDEEDDKLEDKINGVVQDKAEAVQSAKLSRLYVTIVSQDVAVPSSTSKQAEARQEHVYRLKAEEKGEFYVPRGEVPKFVSEKDLDEMGGKPPVVEPRYSVRLMALKRENDEDGDDSTLDASVADEYPLELFEHGTVITSVRLFDEAPPANFSSARAKVPASSPARKRIELRGRQFVAVGTALCPFDGEQARSGGRVLLFKVNRKMAKLELVSLLRLADPVMGIVQVAIPSRDISRTRTARAGGGSGDPSYDCGGFMLVARGRIIDTFRFLRAPDVDPNDEQKNVDPKTGRLAVVETDGTGTNKATIAAIAAARASGGGRKAIDAAKSNAITSAQLTKNGNFYNAQLFVHSLAILSDQYLLVADAYQSVQFVRWIPDKLSLSKLASDLDGPLEPYACEFLVTGNHVGMVVCDSAQNIRVFQYAPTDKQSYQLANIEAGRQANFDLRLNCTSSFHLGKNCVSLSRHRLLRDSAGRSQGEHGDDSQNAVEFASLVSTTDGAAGVMCPIPPATYKRLLALQQVMTYSLPHACGLNPLEYRAAAKHPAGIWKESVRRLRHVLFPVVDGNLVEEFLSLDATKQSDLARSIGTSSERIIEELRNVNSLSWLFC